MNSYRKGTAAGKAEHGLDSQRFPGPRSLVEVRSLAEILATLDEQGTLDGLPFMPEMVRFCGRQLPLARTANRTCEEGSGRMRRMRDTVFLHDLRCDGSAHDGCERRCLIFWKTAWLKPPEQPAAHEPGDPTVDCSPAELKSRIDDRYFCQSTQLAAATSPMSPWDLRPLLQDLLHRAVSPSRFLRLIGLTLQNKALALAGRTGGISRLKGTQDVTLNECLGLQAGDSVRIKTQEEIQPTLDREGCNRGLSFEFDMIPYCGQTRTVSHPVHRMIREDSGRMVTLSNTVALEGVVCEGLLRRGCPRANYLFFRESWLERATDHAADES